jgi:hypothetical protein
LISVAVGDEIDSAAEATGADAAIRAFLALENELIVLCFT